MSEELWTGSQRKAWGYVVNSFDEGLSQTEALKQYRNGGGSIATSSWGELWGRVNEGSTNWSNLYQYGGSDVVDESMYVQTGINFKENYVMQFTVNIRRPDGSIGHDVNRQVESNNRLTVDQWISSANESMSEDLSDPAVSVTAIKDIKFFKKGL